jgi:hypothetical protein
MTTTQATGTADAEFAWARQSIEDSRSYPAIGEDDHDFAPLPCCEFCGTEDAPLFRVDTSAPLACLACEARVLLEVYPQAVAFVAAVVARAAGRAVRS